jgi:hypothetical protein
MLRLLADENFDGDVTRGLLFRAPHLHLIRVQDVELNGAGDAEVLAWAADQNRIVVTHDRSTMPKFAIDRIKRRLAMPGLFVVGDRLPVRETIDELLLIDGCSGMDEWNGRIVFLPL